MSFVVTIKFAFIKTISDFAAMFIRKVEKKNEGSLKRYTYYRLVASYRSRAGKPRQRMVLSLDTLDGRPRQAQAAHQQHRGVVARAARDVP